MLVKLFVSSIIIDLLYNFNRYIQYKYVRKLFEVSSLHQHTVIALYLLDRNDRLIEIFACLSNNRVFYRPEKPCIICLHNILIFPPMILKLNSALHNKTNIKASQSLC